MERVRIWTAHRSVVEMAAEELQNEGIPVTTKFVGAETEMYPSTLCELWLEDDSLLENEEIKRKIDDAISAHPLSEDDAEKIAEMPLQDTVPSAAGVTEVKPRARFGLLTAAILVLVVVVIWLAIRGGATWQGG